MRSERERERERERESQEKESEREREREREREGVQRDKTREKGVRETSRERAERETERERERERDQSERSELNELYYDVHRMEILGSRTSLTHLSLLNYRHKNKDTYKGHIVQSSNHTVLLCYRHYLYEYIMHNRTLNMYIVCGVNIIQRKRKVDSQQHNHVRYARRMPADHVRTQYKTHTHTHTHIHDTHTTHHTYTHTHTHSHTHTFTLDSTHITHAHIHTYTHTAYTHMRRRRC